MSILNDEQKYDIVYNIVAIYTSKQKPNEPLPPAILEELRIMLAFLYSHLSLNLHDYIDYTINRIRDEPENKYLVYALYHGWYNK